MSRRSIEDAKRELRSRPYSYSCLFPERIEEEKRERERRERGKERRQNIETDNILIPSTFEDLCRQTDRSTDVLALIKETLDCT